MNYSVGTVSVLEVVWTLAALPGLGVWVVNLRSAMATRAAARQMYLRGSDSRVVWAGFSVLLTSGFAAVEFVFVVLGVIAMLRYPPTNAIQTTWLSWISAISLLSASALISFIGIRWRVVDEQIVSSARSRTDIAER